MQIHLNEIHVWTAKLTITREKESELFLLLNEDEKNRANRFQYAVHKKRFIATRSALRQLLGVYLGIAPDKIEFGYDEYEKPFLKTANSLALQFNLSHSEDIAVYAFTLEHPIGIDIEKIQPTFSQGVAERFFSPKENEALKHLSTREQVVGFYRLWSRKEALIKAIGKGLSLPLSTFSVSIVDTHEIIALENQQWSLIPIPAQEEYQSALATTQTIKKVLCGSWNFFDQDPLLDKEYHF